MIQWTHEIPVIPGFYWYSCRESPLQMVEAVSYGATLKGGAPRLWIKGRLTGSVHWSDDWQQTYGGFWLGPVRQPELPTGIQKA